MRFRKFMTFKFFLLLLVAWVSVAQAPTASAQTKALIVAQLGQSKATIVVSPDAGQSQWERKAAEDLQKYIGMMSNAHLPIADTRESIAAALDSKSPVFVVGSEALKAEPALQKSLVQVVKKNPTLRADAVVVRRSGNRIYLAGNNDESHYYAVAYLLNQWGCRWYMPTEIGECIPSRSTLQVGNINYVYAPPFEIRRAVNRGITGVAEYERRNFMTGTSYAAHMGSLHSYTSTLAPTGGTAYQVPFTGENTAQEIVKQIAPLYERGVQDIPVAVFTEEYKGDSPREKELRAGIINKYQGMLSSTDALMEMYNKVARILRERYPQSRTKIVGIAMASAFLPPQREIKPEPSLVMWLVPSDIDPIHAMNDIRSPSRQEWRAIMRRWSSVMQGRIGIYDYEEGMLVWRELPVGNIHAFRHDVKEYRDAGILGFSPEARGSLLINPLNVYLRGQLMWNPDANSDALIDEFYGKFYGRAAAPMRRYWQAIFKAWQNTIVTDHEHYAAPAIYTPDLVNELRQHLFSAEALTKPLAEKADASRNEKLYVRRMQLARLSFTLIDNYTTMVRFGATEGNYREAVAAGLQGLANVRALVQFNPELTQTFNLQKADSPLDSNAAWFPGEVKQYQDLAALTDGTKGTLIARMPLEWAFRRDPNNTGLPSGWAYKPVDLSYWNKNKSRSKSKYSSHTRKDYPTTQWEMIRTDLYPQAQGVLHPDWQSFTGHLWYRTEMQLSREQIRDKVHIHFPGLFNEGWLYVNGHLVGHRQQNAFWALNDYRFEWDVDLTEHLKPGVNTFTLRLNNSMYMGGIFRRPFLYRPVG